MACGCSRNKQGRGPRRIPTGSKNQSGNSGGSGTTPNVKSSPNPNEQITAQSEEQKLDEKNMSKKEYERRKRIAILKKMGKI